MKSTTLYRFWAADGSLLYVGITGVAVHRLHAHARDKGWWTEVVSITVEHFTDRTAARQAELDSIRQEKPRYNIADLVERVEPPRVGMRGHNQGSVFWQKRHDKWAAVLPPRMGRKTKYFHSKEAAEGYLAAVLDRAAA